MVFEVNYGTKSVEVSLASAAHTRLSAKAAANLCYRAEERREHLVDHSCVVVFLQVFLI